MSFRLQSGAATRVRAVVALTALSVIALTGPTGCLINSCTDMGCIDSYTVDLSVTFQQPGPPGQYVLNVMTDKGSAIVTCPIPTSGCCAPSQSSTVVVSACPVMDGAALSRIDVTIEDQPAKVTVQVSRDGTQVGSKTFAPHYYAYELNGKGCGYCHAVSPEKLTI